MMRSRLTGIAILAGAFFCVCPFAAAQQVSPSNAAVAQLRYDEAMALAKEGKFEEACPKFADSDRLDPTPTTKAQLADCFEHIGRVASAWTLFQDVADAFDARGDTKKADYARGRAQKLIPRLPKLKIEVSIEAQGPALHVHRNGDPFDAPFWGQEVPVDPGDHVITATAPDKKTWERKAQLHEGELVVVTIPGLEDLPKPVEAKKPPEVKITRPPQPQPSPNWALRGTAIGLAAVGVAGIAVGVTYGVQAESKWKEALSHCGANGERDQCDDRGISLGNEVGDLASASTGGFIGGGVALGAAAGVLGYLLFADSPRKQTSGLLVVPSFGPGHASATVHVQF